MPKYEKILVRFQPNFSVPQKTPERPFPQILKVLGRVEGIRWSRTKKKVENDPKTSLEAPFEFRLSIRKLQK